MTIYYDVDKMLRALQAEKATIVLDEEWSKEEQQNYIIHMFNFTFIPPAWKIAQEAAEIAYRQRKWRGQEHEWKTAWKPNK